MLRDLSWLICGIFTLCLFVCVALVSPTRSTFPNGTIKSASCYLLISFRDYECCGGLTLERKCPGSIFHLWLFIGIAQELHWSCTKMTISVLKVSRPAKNKDLKPMALTSTISWYICTLWPSSSFCWSQKSVYCFRHLNVYLECLPCTVACIHPDVLRLSGCIALTCDAHIPAEHEIELSNTNMQLNCSPGLADVTVHASRTVAVKIIKNCM